MYMTYKMIGFVHRYSFEVHTAIYHDLYGPANYI